MLDFIDTNLFKEHTNINVIVYSANVKRAKKEIHKLVEHESVIMYKETEDTLHIQVLKNMRVIHVYNVPLSFHSRGQRSQYAIMDSDVFEMKDGHELFQILAFAKNMISDHTLSDEKTRPTKTIMMF